MKYVKNSNLPLIIGAIVILAIGLVIGLNINKKEVYTRIDMVASTGSNNSNNEIEVIGDEIDIKEEPVISDNKNNSIDNISNNDSTSSKNTQSNNSTNNTNDISETITYSNNDEVVINSLESSLSKINNGDGSDSSFADSAKWVFVSIVDFLFYDGEINGITFDELTDSGKQKVLEIASKVDSAIESKIPGYKETISSTASKAFNKASEIIKSGANNLNNFAREKLGEENYQSIIDAKDELVYYTKNAMSFLGDVGGKVFNSVKDKLDSWYQDFKNN
ncbi:MAG TPA: hypothetical protein IAB58_01490 [Candidatus Pelethosoma merdigallinarum]|nr:hypothetical protein [Candidatus Pelethosoma merdigallinarum]